MTPFLSVPLIVAGTVLHPVRNHGRTDRSAARITKSHDLPVVGERVAESDDVRDAPKVLAKLGDAAKGCAGYLEDGELPVVKVLSRDPLKESADELRSPTAAGVTCWSSPTTTI